MFYENDRIVSKNAKWVNSKARSFIKDAKSSGMGNNQILKRIEQLLSFEQTEFKVDVLNTAKRLIQRSISE